MLFLTAQPVNWITTVQFLEGLLAAFSSPGVEESIQLFFLMASRCSLPRCESCQPSELDAFPQIISEAKNAQNTAFTPIIVSHFSAWVHQYFFCLSSPSGMARMDRRAAPDMTYNRTDVVLLPVHRIIGIGRI
jgi:hypothetical protein